MKIVDLSHAMNVHTPGWVGYAGNRMYYAQNIQTQRVVAQRILAELRGGAPPEPYAGRGSCYVEFGHDQVGRVDVDFLSGPRPTGRFHPPTDALVAEKVHFGASRLQRWFGRQAETVAAR